MMATSAPELVALGGVRVAWGSFLVYAPDRAVALLGGPSEVAGRRVARVLGVRHLAQGVGEVLLARRGGAGRARHLGAVVDALHAASAVGLAVADHRWRRAALIDASVAIAFAGGGLLVDARR